MLATHCQNLVQLANPSWPIYDALIVHLVFSTLQCNVLAEIDSVAIATADSNRGEPLNTSNAHASVIDSILYHSLVAICNMHPARRRPLNALSVHAEEISLGECLKDIAASEMKLKTCQPSSGVPTKTVPGRDLGNFLW